MKDSWSWLQPVLKIFPKGTVLTPLVWIVLFLVCAAVTSFQLEHYFLGSVLLVGMGYVLFCIGQAFAYLVRHNPKALLPVEGHLELSKQQLESDAKPRIGAEREEKITFQQCTPYQRKMLHTIAKHGRFGEDPRWGFLVTTQERDYKEFAVGQMDLHRVGLTRIGNHGLVGLTEEGIEFCQQNRALLEEEPFYDEFDSLEEDPS